MKDVILYLRTDITNQEMTAGGSVAHTLGVVQGFIDIGYDVICASSCMQDILKNIKIKQLVKLKNPLFLSFLRWKINCFLSSFIFPFQIIYSMKNENILFIYQRYSLLNTTGIFLKWFYRKRLVLEYNGSESWIATNWITRKRWITLKWLMNKIESINLNNADVVVVVSNVLKEEIISRNISHEKILVNPNGVDMMKYQ